MGVFTVVPQSTFEDMQLDAGVLLKTFNPASPSAPSDSDIITATTGGINVVCKPNFSDLGEDVDNVPNNMKELKKLESWDCSISTTALGTSPELIKMQLGCADIDGSDSSKIIPRAELRQTDFSDIWWVGDKADGGMVAVQIKNALSTEGFSLQSTKNGKGTSSLTITGHVSINAQNEVPMVFYSAEGSSLKSLYLTSFAGSASGKTDITVSGTAPASGQSYKYILGSAPASVTYEQVLTDGWTSWNGSDAISATTGQIITVAIVTTSNNKAQAVGSVMVTAKA